MKIETEDDFYSPVDPRDLSAALHGIYLSQHSQLPHYGNINQFCHNSSTYYNGELEEPDKIIGDRKGDDDNYGEPSMTHGSWL